MRATALLLATAAFSYVACEAAVPRAEDANDNTLRVCLEENAPPYSIRQGDTGTGFDVLMADAVAKRLERRLAVQWFESKPDETSSSTVEADALLSDGHCDLIAGYPLVKDALGKPAAETAKLPDFAGARPADRRRRVALGTLVPSTPYHFAPLTVVLGGKAAEKHIASIADLDGINLGIEGGTLGDGILMRFDNGRFIPRITHVAPGRGKLLPGLESGEYDATITPLHHFDVYRMDHPDTQLKPSGYYLRIGFNMGFVGLANAAPLIEQVNAALDDMLKAGEPASLALKAHMTYLPPRRPYILQGITMSDLAEQ